MAEENNKSGAQQGIGSLFVELGAVGVGSLLKGLNAVSLGFQTVGKGAKLMADTVVKPAKEAGNAAVEVGKLSNSLDTSDKNIQKLQYHLKKFNVSEGLVNDLGNIQTTLRDVLTGYADMPASFATAFAKTGHILEDYTDDFDDVLRLVKDLQQADLTTTDRNQIFDFLGMSRDWGYLFSRSDFNLEGALALPDDVIEKNIKTAENLAEFGLAMGNLKNLLVAEFLPSLTKFVEWFTTTVSKLIDNKDEIEDDVKDKVKKAGKNPIISATKGLVTTPLGGIAAATTGITNTAYQVHKAVKTKGITTGLAASIMPLNLQQNQSNILPPILQENPGVPSNVSNLTQTIYINNENNIQGDNAAEIADRLTSINSKDIEYTQYQLSNLAGL